MGCGTVKEKLEYQIMVLKVEKLDIIQERAEKLKELEKITGEHVIRKPVPNYLVPVEKKEDSNEGNDTNEDKKTEHSTRKKSNASSKKKKKKEEEEEIEEEEDEEEEEEDEE